MSGDILHASAVALNGAAVCITGGSGSGKSGLALQLMGYGAQLVADDGCRIWAQDGALWVDAVDTIQGRIEARGIGILNAAAAGPTRLALWVDLDQTEPHRLPPQREKVCLGVSLPIVHNAQTQHFAASILQYLRAGRNA
ncbi:serine kinase [Thalassobius vesicularis]|uniref:Serine kinase n=1 Tax=Thalassobius vesicularis TaxID=1294297 RepID=A0A4S3ME98_9RHOB|nr:serine kinase [Thalassobius vesicularis]THD76448.1 serine kinase [Thalassobius vesicularis]